MKRKILSIVMALTVVIGIVFAGCGSKTVDIFAAQSEDDTEGQLKILENCISKGYKAIGVAPISPTNLINGIVEANKKGIYVMNIDEKIDMDTLKNAGGSVIAFATTDNEKVGEKGANYIMEQLKDGGEVAIIEGKAGNASGEYRKNGATNAFTANSAFKLVDSQPADWDRQKALDTAASMIQKYPNLKAIYCCNDTMALGALQAVKNANKLGKKDNGSRYRRCSRSHRQRKSRRAFSNSCSGLSGNRCCFT